MFCPSTFSISSWEEKIGRDFPEIGFQTSKNCQWYQCEFEHTESLKDEQLNKFGITLLSLSFLVFFTSFYIFALLSVICYLFFFWCLSYSQFNAATPLVSISFRPLSRNSNLNKLGQNSWLKQKDEVCKPPGCKVIEFVQTSWSRATIERLCINLCLQRKRKKTLRVCKF